MSIRTSWCPLAGSVSADGGLLVGYDFNATGYTVKLTDLRSLWIEKLEYGAILGRVDSLSCPIDPREGDDQRRRLFELIAGALAGSLGSVSRLEYDDKARSMELDIEVALPKPLSMLRWTFSLQAETSNAFLEHVTGPVIQRAYQQGQDMRSLQSIIKDKDHVIDRLLDRIENQGIDLSAVFPGTSNIKVPRNADSRVYLGRSVKGLGRFDATTWQTDKSEIDDSARLSSAFEDVDTLGPDSHCWRLGADQLRIQRPSRRGIPQATDSPARGEMDHSGASETEDEDGFQVQTLPQNPAGSDRSESRSVSVDMLSPPQSASRSVKSPRFLLSPQPKGRLGKTGGIKAGLVEVSHRSRSQSTEANDPSSLMNNGSTVALRRLGKLGGHPNPLRQDAAVADSDHDSTKAHTILEDNKADQTPRVATGQQIVEHGSKEIPERTGQPRASSEERANQRRDELKRQLATRPVDGTTRKKRKF